VDVRARFGFTAAPGTTDDARVRHLTLALPPQYAARLFDAQDVGAGEQQLRAIAAEGLDEMYFPATKATVPTASTCSSPTLSTSTSNCSRVWRWCLAGPSPRARLPAIGRAGIGSVGFAVGRRSAASGARCCRRSQGFHLDMRSLIPGGRLETGEGNFHQREDSRAAVHHPP
jgi:hypothetical protein